MVLRRDGNVPKALMRRVRRQDSVHPFEMPAFGRNRTPAAGMDKRVMYGAQLLKLSATACKHAVNRVEEHAGVRAPAVGIRIDVVFEQHFSAGGAAQRGFLPIGLVQKPGKPRRRGVSVSRPVPFLIVRCGQAVADKRDPEIRPERGIMQRNLESERKRGKGPRDLAGPLKQTLPPRAVKDFGGNLRPYQGQQLSHGSRNLLEAFLRKGPFLLDAHVRETPLGPVTMVARWKGHHSNSVHRKQYRKPLRKFNRSPARD